MVRFQKLSLMAILSVTIQSAPLWAQEDRLQPDFTFKRVTVPTKDSKAPRITVQTGTEQSVATPAPTGGPVTIPKATGLEWFWLAVSADQSAAVPGRLSEALSAIDQAPDGKDVPTPRLQTLQTIANAYGLDILRATVGTDVSPALVLSIIAIESSGQVAAESSAGARGLMQLMPATAARFDVTDRDDPAQNIQGGVAYLDWLMNHFDKDPILVLAGYNAGEGAVRDNNGVPPFAETRAYVPKVLATWKTARGLCITPPELITDGCVFHNNGA